MISLCYGHRPVPLPMTSTSNYYHEWLLADIKRYHNCRQRITIRVGDQDISLKTKEEIELATKIVASYHNQYVSTVPLIMENFAQISEEYPTVD